MFRVILSKRNGIKFESIAFTILKKGTRKHGHFFHDGLRRETCSDTRLTLAQYPIILDVHSVHFANFLRGIYTGMILNV